MIDGELKDRVAAVTREAFLKTRHGSRAALAEVLAELRLADVPIAAPHEALVPVLERPGPPRSLGGRRLSNRVCRAAVAGWSR